MAKFKSLFGFFILVGVISIAVFYFSARNTKAAAGITITRIDNRNASLTQIIDSDNGIVCYMNYNNSGSGISCVKR